ncbi:MAG: hypothetical protein OWS74_04340, partial [Firmicutes bacterium]|nr:hypothetical protein [Bacillota bacterium]
LLDTKPVAGGGNDNIGNYGAFVAEVQGKVVREWQEIQWNDERTRFYVWRPEQMAISPDLFNDFFTFMSTLTWNVKGETVAYPFLIIIDELIDLAASDKSRMTYLHGMNKILTQGRAALQTIWFLTQYPRWIEGGIKRLTTARFIFRLPDPSDREYAAKLIGWKAVAKAIPYPYGFWYQNDMILSTTVRPRFYEGQD